jgi:hypothetical protein
MKAYEILTLASLKSCHQSAHLFIVLAWNLMTRSASTADLVYNVIAWSGDHIIVSVVGTKSDPRALGPTAKAVYANPTNPAICPYLSFGIHILSHPIESTNGTMIFPATATESNFNNFLKNELINIGFDPSCGFDPTNITAHSTRKGAPSYAVSIPGVSSVISVWLRAGWLLGGVIPLYIQLEEGGDEKVGRVVAGLNPMNATFGTLPARFNITNTDSATAIDWNEIIVNLNLYPKSFRIVIPYLIAAVVHHSAWITNNIPNTHPIFRSRFWTKGLHDILSEYTLRTCIYMYIYR